MTDIPQAAIHARQGYAAGNPVRQILAETELSLFKLYYWVQGARQRDGTTLLSPIPLRRIVKRKPDPARARMALVARIMSVAEKQLQKIEQRLATAGYKPDDGDRDSRALAVLARSVRELTALEAPNHAGHTPGDAKKSNDPVPRNVDQLREQLLRKMDALLTARELAVEARNGP